jgi:hypothetical protein
MKKIKLTDMNNEQERFTHDDAYSEYFEDDENKAERFTMTIAKILD